jgi:NarL family two-component system response regulator YdfI
MIGTPAYMSPEQAQGQRVDLRTDIYSLGIVLFEMATGELPFDSDDIPALLLQQVKQQPPPLRSIQPNIPPALESVILKTLEKNPSRRFQTADALASALKASIAPVGADAAAPVPLTSSHDSNRRTVLSTHTTLRIVLADDHTLMRKSLASMLEASEKFVVVGEAANGDEALSKVKDVLPDVLILDLNMPVRSGLDVLPDIRAAAPAVKVLVLTGRNEDWYIMQALRAGAHGYILKSAEENDLIEAVEKVTQGHLVLGEGVAEKVVTGLLGGGQSDKLTETERMLLLHVAAGLENDQIARRLGIGMTQIIEVLASAMNKLGARDRNGAALQALQRGYILLDELHAITS